MYRLRVYIDEPDTEPIEFLTNIPNTETECALKSGCFDEKTGTTWPPHRIAKITREKIVN